MPITSTTATPDLDAFLRRHGHETGALPGELDPSVRATWLCWMCWVAPAGGAVAESAGR